MILYGLAYFSNVDLDIKSTQFLLREWLLYELHIIFLSTAYFLDYHAIYY